MNDITHTHRRAALLSHMQEGIAIVGTAPQRIRSNDTEYPYRPGSDFYYLTGFTEDDAVLVLIHRKESNKVVLFVHPVDEKEALWNGARLGVEKGKERFGVDEVYGTDEFEAKLPELMLNLPRLYADPFDDERWFEPARKCAAALRHKRDTKRPVCEILDVTRLIREQRLIKDKSEIETIRQGLLITAEAHHQAMQRTHEGKMEYAVQAEFEYTFARNGATSAYTTIVAGGNSANTLHYIANDRPLHDGELVLIDAGCEYGYYATDITRTFPVRGRFSEAQKTVYELVLSVQEEIIAAIAPGRSRKELQELSEKLLCQGMVALGILSGEIDKLIEEKSHRRYYPHGIGHWLGIDVHDPSPYYDEAGESLILRPGMIMTVEPGLYLPADDEAVPEAYRGIGVRIEDDVLVTEGGHEVLSAAIVKRVADVEAMCAQTGQGG